MGQKLDFRKCLIDRCFSDGRCRREGHLSQFRMRMGKKTLEALGKMFLALAAAVFIIGILLPGAEIEWYGVKVVLSFVEFVLLMGVGVFFLEAANDVA